VGAFLLNWAGPDLMVPQGAPSDQAVASNYERFDGLTDLSHPAGNQDNVFWPGDKTPRPGMQPTPDVYTPGPLAGVVGTLGGQPLPVSDRLKKLPGSATYTVAPSVQFRLGVGQKYQGVAQTVALADITNNPPVPDGMSSILAGWG
jgi:hypothetical protein